MNTSQSFDRAESVYDQTRPLSEPAATRGIQAILDITGPEAFILDAGAGTGCISVPLLERGARLIGCDLSIKMLRRLQGKFPVAQVAQSDVASLSFFGSGSSMAPNLSTAPESSGWNMLPHTYKSLK